MVGKPRVLMLQSAAVLGLRASHCDAAFVFFGNMKLFYIYVFAVIIMLKREF